MRQAFNKKSSEALNGRFPLRFEFRDKFQRALKPMATRLFCLFSISLIFLCSCVPPDGNRTQSNNTANSLPEATVTPTVTPTPETAEGTPEFDTESWLEKRIEDKSLHAALVATLEPGKTLARHNVDKTFNPASLVKLATTLTALTKLGADHRFAVRVFADGELVENETLEGNLYFAGGAPTFNETTAEFVADELRKRGIRRITGKFCVSPDFSFNFSESAERSVDRLADRLGFNRKPKTCVSDQPSGTEIFVLKSHPLRAVLLYQNTHSNNFVAERVGAAVGGAEGVRQFLINEIGLPPDEIKLGSTSGLKENAMTARGVFTVLRELEAELKRQNLQPFDVLPLASVNNSTLRTRLTESEFESAVVGKTGTLSAADGGVGMASLAGYIYTRDAGIFAFVLMNQGREIIRHRDLQDELLVEILRDRLEPRNVDAENSRDLLSGSDLIIEDQNELVRKGKN